MVCIATKSVGFFLFFHLQMIGEGGMKQECSVDDLVKTVEDLTRIH